MFNPYHMLVLHTGYKIPQAGWAALCHYLLSVESYSELFELLELLFGVPLPHLWVVLFIRIKVIVLFAVIELANVTS